MSLTSGVPSLADFSLAGLRGALSNAAVAAVVVVSGSAVLPGLDLRTELPTQVTPTQTAMGAGSTGSGGLTLSGTGNGVSTKPPHQGPGTKSKATKGHDHGGRPGGSEKAGAGGTHDPAPQKPEGGSGQIHGNESDDKPSGSGSGGDNSGSGRGDNSGSGGGDNSGSGGDTSGSGGGDDSGSGEDNSDSDHDDHDRSDSGVGDDSGSHHHGDGGGCVARSHRSPHLLEAVLPLPRPSVSRARCGQKAAG
jgi:hypothetical protein